MIILAHRGLCRGPDPSRENRLDTMREALGEGFGLETDIRFSRGRAYISHDPLIDGGGASADGSAHAALWAGATQPIALNFKEPGTEIRMVEFLRRNGVVDNVCMFDMELVEQVPGATAIMLIDALPDLRLASRASDRGEPLERALELPGNVVWMDEFEKPWIRRGHVDAVHASGRLAWMVLPDLHGRGRDDMLVRLAAFAEWGVDAVCTDWAFEARRFLEGAT